MRVVKPKPKTHAFRMKIHILYIYDTYTKHILHIYYAIHILHYTIHILYI
jgi:hypothetical protein